MIPRARGDSATRMLIARGIISDLKDDPCREHILNVAREMGWPIDAALAEMKVWDWDNVFASHC